jgi:hypothetical protein
MGAALSTGRVIGEGDERLMSEQDSNQLSVYMASFQ